MHDDSPTPTPARAPAARLLSPRRKTTAAHDADSLAREQLAHFHLDPATELGGAMLRLARRLYDAHDDLAALWAATLRELAGLARRDRLAVFNAQKFLCFQLAKLLDELQNPFRKSHQALGYGNATLLAQGPYPIFDNVAALFSANPVITRTATYIFACAEWIDDAFQGREFLHEIYSRLLNPTSISLANHIVDIEAGPLAAEYLAWNFNSGMAAIDSVLSHLVGYEDIILVNRNVYGGTYQLLHDWYAKPANLNVAVEFFDGDGASDFSHAWDAVRAKHAARLAAGRQVYVFLESPCNPHGTWLDVPAICRAAHAAGLTVMLDSTVATPFLARPLQRPSRAERPDFVIHSYTKDLTGGGNTTAGVVIGRNEAMFKPKGDPGWDETLFWNVYYVKGAFLDADKAFEVLSGMKTLELRMLKKCINTLILARWLATHPAITVNCSGLPGHPNHTVLTTQSYLELPAPLFTIDFERAGLDRLAFERFFDCLSPMFGHMVTLGQSNTVVLCPALTSHSELSPEALRAAGIAPTTIRIAVGDEAPRELIASFLHSVQLALDPAQPDFSAAFAGGTAVDELCDRTYIDVHTRHAAAEPRFATCLA